MDLFLPWANAMLVEQIDNELPVKWTDLVHRCSTVKDLALELIEFFDINIHWKHRELYDALTVVAGLKRIEDKSLNSLDLRLRVETLLDMKLKGEDFQVRRASRKLEKERKITENPEDTCIKTEQSAETTGSRERKKKRKKKKKDHEKVPGEKKQKFKTHRQCKRKRGCKEKRFLMQLRLSIKREQGRQKLQKKPKLLRVISRSQIHVYESVTDVRSEETEGNSRKKASEKNC